MDEVLALVLLVPDARIRRILNARALVGPLNGTHLYGWTRLAVVLGSNRHRVALDHERGLKVIATALAPPKVAHFRQSIPGSLSVPTLPLTPLPPHANAF